MPAVFPQVGRDPVRSRGLAGQSGCNRVRLAPSPSPVAGLAQRGHVVDINSQLQPGHIVTFWAVPLRARPALFCWAGSPAPVYHNGRRTGIRTNPANTPTRPTPRP